MSDLNLDILNSAQRRAVTTIDGPVLVLAGPGSGKTRVLTHRIAYMLEVRDIPARNIMAVTFTNKAAREMRHRLEGLLGYDYNSRMLGTFHAICAIILRREYEATPYKSNFTIYDTGDQISLIKNIITEMQKDPKQHRPNSILSAISAAKNELIEPQDMTGGSYRDDVVREVYKRYMEKLQRSNALDFDDLLTQVVYLFRNHPDVLQRYQSWYPYIMVDEFQDTNMAQYEMLRLLSQRSSNLFVVGDPDQSIYAFRGADYRNVQRFMKDFPTYTLVSLDENYRSHQLILDAAMAVIRKDPAHIQRQLFSQRTSGPQIQVCELDSERDEGQYIVRKIRELMQSEGYTYRDFALMYRTNAQSRVLEEDFRRAVIPYKLVGGVRFYERMEIKDLMAYIRLIANPDDSVSFNRIVNTPPRGIGKKSIETFEAWLSQNRLTISEGLKHLQAGNPSPLTGRAAKGLIEFADMLDGWVATSKSPDFNIIDLFDTVIEQTQYKLHIGAQGTSDEAEDRLANIEELRRGLGEYEDHTLEEILASIALIADVDSMDGSDDNVTLMTLHAAKGLEFPVVFIAGLEEGLLPHSRSVEDPMQMAEERRLMYVGITRAKDHLFLSHTNIRYMPSGGTQYNDPSRFLFDLPEDICLYVSPSPTRTVERMNNKRFTTMTSWATAPQKEKPKAIEARFKPKMIVSHPKFGQGTVISSMVRADMEEVTVRFESVGLKKLDGEFLTIG